jgi:hypothetical protein
MKKVIYTLIIQSVLLLHNYSYGQSASLNSVTIKWVDFNIETIADVSCDAFDNSFNEGKQIYCNFKPYSMSLNQSKICDLSIRAVRLTLFMVKTATNIASTYLAIFIKTENTTLTKSS